MSLPHDFAQCTNDSQRQAWIASERGQGMINARPRIKQAMQRGQLMLSSPQVLALLNEVLLDRPNMQKVQQMMANMNIDAGHSSASAGTRVSSGLGATPSVSGGGNGGIFGGLFSRLRAGNPAQGIKPIHSTDSSSQLSYPSEPFPTDVKLKLLTEGYAVLKNHVSLNICERAVKYINHQLGNVSFVSAMQSDNNPSFQFQMSSQKELMNCYTSQLVGEVSELLHGLRGQHSPILPRACQIALRFPTLEEPPSSGRLGGKQWHIDGMNKGDYAPFTLLVGVALSDQPMPFMGNLCVHPGTHHTLQEPVRTFAREISSSGAAVDGNVGMRAWLAMGALDLGEPEQLIVERGDVVLLHQRVAHRGAPNVVGCSIRQMLYFRISHENHELLKEVSIDDLWVEYEGMKDISWVDEMM